MHVVKRFFVESCASVHVVMRFFYRVMCSCACVVVSVAVRTATVVSGGHVCLHTVVCLCLCVVVSVAVHAAATVVRRPLNLTQSMYLKM